MKNRPNPFGQEPRGPQPPTTGLARLVKVLTGLAIFIAVISFIGSTGIYIFFSRNLPRINSLQDYDPYVVSEVYSQDGTKMGEFWKECRYLLPYDEMPEQVIQAFIASEDGRFFTHGGVDFFGIIRAFIKNMQAGRIVEGASTITQQIARSFFLSREKKITRKIKEAILATQIEKNLSKEEILYLYLNQIYLGNRAYGVEAAARNYYHKNIEQLNLAETALLAGLPSAPAHFSPINDMKLARERQVHVLNRMVDEKFITKNEAKVALDTTLTIYRAGTDKDFNMKHAPYFTEEVRRHLIEKYGEDFIYKKGMRIYTTADIKITHAAQNAIKRGLLRVSKQQGFQGPLTRLKKEDVEKYTRHVHKESFDKFGTLTFPEGTPPSELPTPIVDQHLYKAVLTDIQTNTWTVLVGNVEGIIARQDRLWAWARVSPGDVVWVEKKRMSTAEKKSGIYKSDTPYFTLARIPLLEGALYAIEPKTGKVRAMVGGYDFARSEFNRTVQAQRQPGSAFKPIVYAAALDKGYSPKTIITDSPVTFQVGDDEYWTPKNYGGSFRGPMTLKSGLTNSVNIIAVKILHDIGLDYLVAYARKLGIQSEIFPYLSSALGASDTNLKEMTDAYTVFASEGQRNPSYLVRMIVDQQGNVVEKFPPETTVPELEVGEDVQKPDSEDMNTALLNEGLGFIKEKNLQLTPEELKLLYGAKIPKGHAITPQTAYLMTTLLKNVVDFGTGFKAKELERPAAGKTGTTNDETDALFIGYTPQIIAGVWVGFDELKKIGKKMTGGVVAAPIWRDFMRESLEGKPVLDFKPPADLDVAQLDSLTGGSAELEAREELPDTMSVSHKEASPDRSVDFLYEDTSEL